MKKHLLGFLLVILAVLSGCMNSQRDVQKARLIERDVQMTCTPADPHQCAIPSQFQVLSATAATSSDSLHYVSLFNIGQDELMTRIHMIRAAHESIVLQTFIYDDDDVGQMMFRELLAAACRGVKVRLILDQFGTYMTPETVALMATAHQNLDIKFFSPIMNRGGKSASREIGTLLLNFKQLNERMHNKLFAVDGCMAIVGGRNISNAYFDYGKTVNFKDLGMLVIGPVVDKMYESFDIFWNHEKCVSVMELPDVASAALALGTIGQPSMFEMSADRFEQLCLAANAYSIFEVRPALALYPVYHVEYIADWPVKNERTFQARQWDSTERIKEVMLSARESIIMQTPYLINEFKGLRDFQQYRRGHEKLDIALSTNSLASSDMPIAYAITFKQRQYYLEKLHSRLYEFKPVPDDVLQMMPRYQWTEASPSDSESDLDKQSQSGRPPEYEGPDLCLHGKYFVVDDYVSFVGSHNFDPRANNLNTENGLIVWDETVGAELHRIFNQDTAPPNSWVAARHPKLPVIGPASDMIASISSQLPIFDLWPFFFSNTYDLKDNKKALTPQDPDFYHHYINVGVFPQVGLMDQLMIRFYLAFGGIARDFL